MEKQKLLYRRNISVLVGFLLGVIINVPVKVTGGTYWTNSIYQFGVGNFVGGLGIPLMFGLMGYLFYFLIWGVRDGTIWFFL